MKTMYRCALPVIVALTLMSACSREPEARTYHLQGQILAVRAETKEILVRHDDIPGFMPAMTMPYAVKDAALLADRSPGDLIDATLVVAPDLAWLSSITRTGHAPLPEGTATTIPAAAGVHLLRVGDSVSDTPLTDQDDRPFVLSDWRGSAVVVTFIYTSCPLPQFCPLLDRRFAELQALAGDDTSLRGRVRLLSISFDPAIDTPARLRNHAVRLHADPDVWRFATAPEMIVDRLAATFGVNVIRENDRTITHNLRTAVLDPKGTVVAVHDHNDWTAADIIDELKTAVLAR